MPLEVSADAIQQVLAGTELGEGVVGAEMRGNRCVPDPTLFRNGGHWELRARAERGPEDAIPVVAVRG